MNNVSIADLIRSDVINQEQRQYKSPFYCKGSKLVEENKIYLLDKDDGESQEVAYKVKGNLPEIIEEVKRSALKAGVVLRIERNSKEKSGVDRSGKSYTYLETLLVCNRSERLSQKTRARSTQQLMPEETNAPNESITLDSLEDRQQQLRSAFGNHYIFDDRSLEQQRLSRYVMRPLSKLWFTSKVGIIGGMYVCMCMYVLCVCACMYV